MVMQQQSMNIIPDVRSKITKVSKFNHIANQKPQKAPQQKEMQASINVEAFAKLCAGIDIHMGRRSPHSQATIAACRTQGGLGPWRGVDRSRVLSSSSAPNSFIAASWRSVSNR